VPRLVLPMNAAPLAIRIERPDQPDVTALLDALDGYLHALYPPHANHILDVQALLAPDVRFVVARRAGVALGTGAVRGMPGGADTDFEPFGEIKRMYVAPQARGRRIAEQVLAVLEEMVVADGVRWAMLETGRDQAEALRLYERNGYTRRPPFAGYPDNGSSVFYAKRLPA